MQAAGEILRVVADTISEYQEEISRTKRENKYLKRQLNTPVLSLGMYQASEVASVVPILFRPYLA
jgi:cell shape-determining protein MreC